MNTGKTTFAVFFGNRGFFPSALQDAAREEMAATLGRLGHDMIILDPGATRYGAVETPAEGKIYADFLAENKGRFGGVILCLPNFGDETGAVSALKDAGVPILVQAYPDELDKMAPELRRDAFCGKFSVMDVFVQYGLKFTALPPHTVHPGGSEFDANVDYFDRLCRVVNGMRGLVVGAVGARTTAFKTVRIDELALQSHDITVETLDLSEVFSRMEAMKDSDKKLKAKVDVLGNYSCWDGVPDAAFLKIAKLGVVLDAIVDEYSLDAMAFRCWIECQQQMGISPCVLLSEMNNRGIPVACEVDVGNAVMMQALRCASDDVATCLDWNNNYGSEQDKCILFHCGPVPQKMMTCKGHVGDHAIIANAVGKGCSYGCNEGRIIPGPFTFGSLLTRAGNLHCYLGQGEFTEDTIADDYFGCAGVAQIEELQGALQTIGYAGHRHHVSVTPGHVMAPALEAMTKYLGYEVLTV